MRTKVTHIIFLLATLSSCDLINPKEKLPTYIRIDNFNLDKGGKIITHNISDVWFGTAKQDLGIYELPTTIPVLEDGEFEITASPGVYLNGILSNRSKYFYYTTHREVIKSKGNSEVIEIHPETSYIDAAVFSEKGSDDFENVTFNFEGAEGKKIAIEEDNVLLENNKIGVLYTGNNSTGNIEIKSSDFFKIENDKVNAPVYLEFDYKTTIEMEVGLYISFDDEKETVPLLAFFKTNGKWIHAYVQLDDEVNVSGKETLYKTYFKGKGSGSGKSSIALDNITIVYSE